MDVAAEDTRELADALDERKRSILRAIVTEYIRAGEPVGSKRVVEVAHLDCSAATVRNDMAVLEELGLIHQPHTSAGRVPSDRGYRLFVEELREHAQVGRQEREVVEELLSGAKGVDDLLARTTAVLSQLTRLVSLVIAPAIDTARLKLIELVSLTPQTALLLLVADTGRVNKRLLELPLPVSDHDLDRVRMVLGEHVRGNRMGDVHERLGGLVEHAPPEMRSVLQAIADATATDMTEELLHRIFVSGRASLAGEGYLEREDLEQILALLDEERTLAQVLDRTTTDQGDYPTVRIGAENEVEGLRGTSLVAQRYQLVTSGSLGVLGPTRMDYPTVLSAVRAVAEQLQATLTDLSH